MASLFALAVNGAGAPTSPANDKVNPGAKPAVVSADKPETSLTKAMPADVVRKIMGQPHEIKSMKTPDGKAEVWVYKRQLNESVDRVPVGSIPITVTTIGADGKAYQRTVGEKIQYADLHRATEETVQLLMFNDHFVTCKVARQETRHYN